MHIQVSLSGGVKIFHSVLLGQSFSFLVRHLTLGLEIALVTNEDLDNRGVSVLLDGCQPSLNVLEGLAIVDGEGDNNSMSLLVEGVS